MLVKLLKYEFKATREIFLLAYGVLVVLTGMTAGLLAIRIPRSSSLSGVFGVASVLVTMFYVLVVGALSLLPLVIIAVRFYRLLGDEGYLWFTLPAAPAQHILGKLIPGVVWTAATALVTSASVMLVTIRTGWYAQLGDVWHQLLSQGFNPGAWLALLLIMIVISLLLEILALYASMAIGPNLIKNHRLGGSVLAWVIIYCANQVISVISLIIIALILKDFPNNAANVDASMVNHAAFVFCGIIGIESLAIAVACYFLTHYFISHKLNLA